MGRLDGKVALITGGARGMGAAEAMLFAAEGAKVVLTDILDDEGKATAERCGGLYLHHDVSNEVEWERVTAEIVERHGRLDVLVNNAGMLHTGSIRTTPVEEYRRVIDVNQVGVFLGMKWVAGPMAAQGAGSIVNVSSVVAMRGGGSGAIAYAASKWAVRGMTKIAAIELGRLGIRVNSIHPGAVETPMFHSVPNAESYQEQLRKRIPLGRFGEVEEAARLALFLASEESSYVNGAEITIDGGMIA